MRARQPSPKSKSFSVITKEDSYDTQCLISHSMSFAMRVDMESERV